MKTERVEYKVIEDKRIVIATIKNIEYDAIITFNEKFLSHVTSKLVTDLCGDSQKFLMPRSMKAVARCVPNDEFSVKKGKEIALKKLSEKYNSSLDKHLFNIYIHLDQCLDDMCLYLIKHKMI